MNYFVSETFTDIDHVTMRRLYYKSLEKIVDLQEENTELRNLLAGYINGDKAKKKRRSRV